ncbi:metallophosphoesterase [Paenibacillus agaridevorans]|uniref:metallophosphoesterase n=1 Tax=Paenibacillus agaridevorans TaxID=171404 RepID=UPI001BE40BBA|nr:metallophosphoesterase [Paenibacillus agaridevorans]
MEPFSFGLLADIQYADRPMRMGRYYRNALGKTRQCMDKFNGMSVDFCVHLGDLIDWPDRPDKGREALAAIMPVMREFRGPMYYLLGNHDVDSVPSAELAAWFEMPGGQTWYSFDHKGIHFIALDCNFNAQGIPYRPGANKWDECYLPQPQLRWLEADLAAAQSNVVVLMVHALLDDLEDPHVIKNAPEVRRILENCNKSVVVLQGHMHAGHESVKNGIGYHTLRSIVDGRTRTCYWVVEVGPGGITAAVYDSTRNNGRPTRRVLLEYE